MQLDLFESEKSDWLPPNLSELPTDWNKFKRVGIDLETRDDFLRQLGIGCKRGGYIAGYCLAFEYENSEYKGFYLPVAHQDGGNIDKEQVEAYISQQLKNFTGDLVGANLSYDLGYLVAKGYKFNPSIKYRDVLIAEPLIYELHDKYSLQETALRWGFEGKEISLMDKELERRKLGKGGIHVLHSSFVGPYGETDAILPLQILKKQLKEIEKQELENVFDLESRLLPALVAMRDKGVPVDENRLNSIDYWAQEQQKLAIEEANRHFNIKLGFGDITKPAALAKSLMDIGIELPKTATGKPSVSKHVILGLSHPVGESLRRAKKMSTLRTSFIEGTYKYLVDGRIHSTFNQLRRASDSSEDSTGAAFGRMSCTNPNLQQQPVNDPEIGNRWRAIYKPEEGTSWAALDYSQQEARLMIHWALKAGEKFIGAEANLKALEVADKYKKDSSTDLYTLMAELANIPRKQAKAIYLGMSYNMGGSKLCQDLGLPIQYKVSFGSYKGKYKSNKFFDKESEAREFMLNLRTSGDQCEIYQIAGEEGSKLIEEFKNSVPFVKKTSDFSERVAATRGFVRTVSGRRCRFIELPNGRFDFTHLAINRLVQGTAGDQTKAALVELYESGFDVRNVVHDETNIFISNEKEAKEAAEIMETVIDFEVPSKVDIEIGPSWGEAE